MGPASEAPKDAAGEVAALLKLALPLSLGFAGSTLLGLVDTAMVGRLGSASLGAVGIGNGIFFLLVLVGMGLISGSDPLIAQAVGADEPERARSAYWQSVRIALGVSLPLLALLALIGAALERFGIDRDTAHETRAFLWGRALNAPPFLVFAAARGYLQANHAARPIVVSMVVANVLNFVFDGLFVFGDRALDAVHLPRLGLPALGVFGAGLASTLASLASTAIVLSAASKIRVANAAAVRRYDPVLLRKTISLGTPIALQLLAEVGAFTLATFFCGRLGKMPVAGHHVALSLASFTFTTALGVGSATTVFVGKAVGRGDSHGARRSGFLGFGAGSSFMLLCAAVFFFAPRACARVLTDQEDVIEAAAPLIQIAAVFQLSDAAQGIFAAALRGLGDTRYAQYANLVGHYAVGVPVALFLGFSTPLGARGVWWGLSAGLTCVGVLLALRFNRLSRGPVSRA